MTMATSMISNGKTLYHFEDISASNLSSSTYYGSWDITIPSVSGYKPIAVKSLSINQVNKNIYMHAVSDTALTVGACNISLNGSIGSLSISATIVYVRETA